MEENKPQQNYKDAKVLRTYTSDMADAIRTDEVSVIKIALAEKEKREQEALYKKAEGTKTSKVLLVIGSLILVIAAIAGSYFLIQKKKEIETPAPVPKEAETFITYNASAYIDVTNATNIIEFMDAIKQQEQPSSGLIKAFFLAQKVNGIMEPITAKNFFAKIKTDVPDALVRSLADNFLLGRYSNLNSSNEKEKSAMFLIFQTTDYNQAYMSMLEWENTMLKDLSVLFGITIEPEEGTVLEKPWKDIILNNKDTRVLYDENKEPILYYVFMNKNTFVIADNLETLKEVMTRLIIKNVK